MQIAVRGPIGPKRKPLVTATVAVNKLKKLNNYIEFDPQYNFGWTYAAKILGASIRIQWKDSQMNTAGDPEQQTHACPGLSLRPMRAQAPDLGVVGMHAHTPQSPRLEPGSDPYAVIHVRGWSPPHPHQPPRHAHRILRHFGNYCN